MDRTDMSDLVIVGMGGCTGAISSFLVTRALFANVSHLFPWKTLCINLLGSFTDSLRSQGLEPAFTVTCAASMAPPPDVRDAFAGKPRRLFRLDRLASVADGPLALLTAWLDPARFPDLAAQDFSKVPLYATLERLYGVQMGRALSTIEVVQLRDDEAALLQLPPGASALQVQGTTFDQDDRATEVSRVLYRADRFTFALESYRVGGQLTYVRK